MMLKLLHFIKAHYKKKVIDIDLYNSQSYENYVL